MKLKNVLILFVVGLASACMFVGCGRMAGVRLAQPANLQNTSIPQVPAPEQAVSRATSTAIPAIEFHVTQSNAPDTVDPNTASFSITAVPIAATPTSGSALAEFGLPGLSSTSVVEPFNPAAAVLEGKLTLRALDENHAIVGMTDTGADAFPQSGSFTLSISASQPVAFMELTDQANKSLLLADGKAVPDLMANGAGRVQVPSKGSDKSGYGDPSGGSSSGAGNSSQPPSIPRPN